MRKFIKKQLNSIKSMDNSQLIRRFSIVFGIFLLVVCIIITVYSIQFHKLNQAKAKMQEEIYDRLENIQQLYAHVEDDNVDVRVKLIPELRINYAAAAARNEALALCFGEKSQVLPDSLIEGMDNAIEEYLYAYRQGNDTGLAHADMMDCMRVIDALLEARNSLPVPEEDVLVIHSSEG